MYLYLHRYLYVHLYERICKYILPEKFNFLFLLNIFLFKYLSNSSYITINASGLCGHLGKCMVSLHTCIYRFYGDFWSKQKTHKLCNDIRLLGSILKKN